MSPADVQATFCATLVDEWIHLGVAHTVVAPGSRSTPMALALAGRQELQLHLVHDERAAAFVALGARARRNARRSCCARAARPPPTSSRQSSRPGCPTSRCWSSPPTDLPSCATSERPRRSTRATSTAAPCAGSTTRVSLDAAAATSWRSLARRAFAASKNGPVHLNVPFREPFLGDVGELPVTDVGAGRYVAVDDGCSRRALPSC